MDIEKVDYYVNMHYSLHGKNFDWMDCFKDLIKNSDNKDGSLSDFNMFETMLKYNMDNRTKWGIMIGRFQPFTKGHDETIQEMIRDGVKPLIIIGSIDKDDERNPLTFDERKKLIKKVYPMELKS